MRLRVVRHLIAHAGLQNKCAAVLKLGVQLALQAQQDVSFHAPVVSAIARRVFDHAHSDWAELARAPESDAGFALVRGGGELGPVDGAEGEVGDFQMSSRVAEWRRRAWIRRRRRRGKR